MDKKLDIKIRLEAIITQREAMLAENAFRIGNGQTIAYCEDAMNYLVSELAQLAEENRNMP